MALAAKLVLVLAILYLGLSVFLVVSPASIEFREPQLETLEEDIAELGELEELVNEDLTVGRLEAEAGPDPLAESRALLVLSGRVVDESRAGVPAAEVRLFLRRSFSWLREGRFDRGNRTRLREALRRSRAGETAKTKGDGSFSISGPAFARSTVQIGVRHPSHAPKLVERELQQSAGELRLDDIVLEPGGTAFGFVFTKGGGPLEGAELRWEAAGDRGQGNRGRSGQGRGMRGGRERGERGRRGERRSRVRGNSRSSRPSLGRLVPPARSDASGFFELTQLPPGRFSLRAEKASYLPGSSARFEMKTDARIDCGRILLEPGAELSGVVLDQQGEPIEEAEVVARLSRGALMGRFRGNSQSSRSRGPGRRGRGRNETPGSASPPAVDRTELLKLFRLMGHESKAKTDAKGRFHLDTLPEQGLRLSVRHPRFIDEEREPIEPTRTPELEIRMYRRLAVAGVVVDARNGRPIELYGIAGRRIGEGSRRGG
ncbi:MAG: carboxypeptidase-like regulatory domain-containing protein, partial [Planctomycetota bacterium]